MMLLLLLPLPLWYYTLHSSLQGSQQQEVKFQDQILGKFHDNYRTLRFHEAQDTENARFSVLINVNH